MKVYLINLFICILFSYLAMKYSDRKENLAEVRKPNLLLSLIPIVSMSIVASIRDYVGTDYGNYKDIFYIAQNTKEWFFGDDMAFNATLKLIDNIFNDDKAMFAIYGSLIVIFFVLAIRNISSDFTLSMYLYIAGMFFYSSFNGIRQWFVSAIMFCCYPLFIKRKYNILIPIIIICYFFHSSVIYYVLVFVVVKSRPWGKIMTSVIISGGIIYLFFYKYICIN